MHKRTALPVCVGLFLCLAAFPARAQEDQEEKTAYEYEDSGWESGFDKLIVGMGVLYYSQPYTGVDSQAFPAPLVVAEYKGFFADGKSFGYYAVEEGGFKLAAVLDPRIQGYEPDDSSDLNGMAERDWSLDIGARLEWDNDYFSLSTTLLTDLLDNHQGQELSVVVEKEFFDGFLTPYLGLAWQSKDLVRYYYGVEGNEARPERPVYEPDAELNLLTGLRLAYPVGDNWAVVGDISYEGYGSEIQDSPIVDEDQQLRYMLGGVYRF
ncbi:MAG: MipA/OmpV family protein [Candidatus Omnitrophica bacterium]|nr:MipA/OmpV family protein [Candidatus Omnitrophota bacterium]